MAAVGDAELGQAYAHLLGAQREVIVVELELVLVRQPDVRVRSFAHCMATPPLALPAVPGQGGSRRQGRRHA